jgi:hypothetical protein
MAAGAAQSEGVSLDLAMLPSLTSISRHLGTGITVSRRTENGFETERHSTLPGGSIGATAPVAIALLLPAVQSARGAARRMQSMNNMKQIALAVHNFHDTYRTFPPRYNTDKDGKPLLSWRVHILPFIEQQRLYEQFRFDEPWDSEHNKQLIAQIPPVYRSPESAAAPGKTTYLTIAAKDGIFQPPQANGNGERVPRTTSFADVTDGTSNTAMVVEVKDEQAVIWTKPDDYEYPDQDPGKGLRVRERGMHLIGLADGSVQLLNLAAQDLKALFTRNGGEVVNLR